VERMRLLAQAREAGLTVQVEGDKLVVRGPRRLEALAWEVLAQKPDVIAALHAERNHAVAKVMEVFPGSRVVAESQPAEWPPPGSWRIEKRQHWELPESELGPCYACGEQAWERGDGVWVCRRCHPDPMRSHADEPEELSADRAALLDLARDHRWPEVEFKLGHSTVGTEAGWWTFARTVREEDLLAACHALEACREDKLS